jgi:transcriptional regulator with XRE-family HTH domain
MEESALRRIELGGTNPTFKTLLRLSKGLEVPLKELLDIPLP